MTQPPVRFLDSGRWMICRLGHVHWGAFGGAGLLLRHVPKEGDPTFLLQQRTRWVDEGGTWGMPGGAMRRGESPEAAARREAEEEVGALPAYRVTGVEAQECGGGWTFQIVAADVDDQFEAICSQETDATGWFTRTQMRQLPLHPGIERWLRE
jgi:8-oxo-dGTP diphosphatase